MTAPLLLTAIIVWAAGAAVDLTVGRGDDAGPG